MSNKKQVIKLKVCVVGDKNAGKTTFIQKVIGEQQT